MKKKQKKGKAQMKKVKKGKKVYSKIHISPVAVKGHTKNIKKRGGKVTKSRVGKNTKLDYSFSSK